MGKNRNRVRKTNAYKHQKKQNQKISKRIEVAAFKSYSVIAPLIADRELEPEGVIFSVSYSIWKVIVSGFGKLDTDVLKQSVRGHCGNIDLPAKQRIDLCNKFIFTCKAINNTYRDYRDRVCAHMPSIIAGWSNRIFKEKFGDIPDAVRVYILSSVLNEFGFPNDINVRYLYIDKPMKIDYEHSINCVYIPEYHVRLRDIGYDLFIEKHENCQLATKEEFDDYYTLIHAATKYFNISFAHSPSCAFHDHKILETPYETLQFINHTQNKSHTNNTWKCSCNFINSMQLFKYIANIETLRHELANSTQPSEVDAPQLSRVDTPELENLTRDYDVDEREFDKSYLIFKDSINDDTHVYNGSDWVYVSSIISVMCSIITRDIKELR